MKKKLIIVFMLIGCVPLLLSSFIFYNQLHSKTLNENTLESEKKLASSKTEIQNLVENRLIILRTLAQNPSMKAMDVAGAKVALVNAQTSNPELILVLDDLAGKPLARGDEISLNYNVFDRQFFKQALTGKEAISEVLVSKTTGLPILVLAVPVTRGQTLVGITQVSIELKSLGTYVKEASNQNTIVYIIDTDGKIIVHPDAAIAKERTDLSKFDFVQRALKGESGQALRKDRNGRDAIVHYTRDELTGWIVCTETPKDIIMAGLNRMTIFIIVGIVALMAIVFAAGYVFSARITKPIRLLNHNVGEIAGGNLSVSSLNFKDRDEIGELGRSFDLMATNLRGLVQKVSSSAEQVAASSQELTASSEQAAQAANHVAIAINTVATGTGEELAAANDASVVVEEMSASIQQIAAKANLVSGQSEQATEKAKNGSTAVGKAVNQMIQIEDTVNTSAQVVAKLGERSKEIGQIVDTISGIAGQTNLLALNAAIEAARAGEQGRGFAVVAEEVRKLAEQSEEAAKKIASLVGEIQTDTGKAVDAMNNGTREVKTGTDVVNAAGASFREIAELVGEVSAQVKQMSEGIQQMAVGSQRIVSSVQQIDTLSKKSAGEAQSVSAATEEQLASMEEIASSSQALAKLAQDLQSAVSGFRV
ncbi:MAG TPA: methyl-accepting chemotaxis protein [Negativicutes bacterium]|nr:methyl-accepting chemotaxis protein [Negativicutes bacterium]